MGYIKNFLKRSSLFRLYNLVGDVNNVDGFVVVRIYCLASYWVAYSSTEIYEYTDQNQLQPITG